MRNSADQIDTSHLCGTEANSACEAEHTCLKTKVIANVVRSGSQATVKCTHLPSTTKKQEFVVRCQVLEHDSQDYIPIVSS